MTKPAFPLVLSAAAALVACDARVDRFAATAHYVCAGQPVTLSWKVAGSASLIASPPLAPLDGHGVDDEGAITIAPSTTTHVELRVSRFLGHATSSVQEIRVLDATPSAEPLTASLADPASAAGCDGGKIWATIHPKRFAPDLKVATVATHAGDARTYEVQHAGTTAAVAPGAPVTAFAGAPILGDWVLISPLRPGETCGTPTVPRALVVDVLTQCVAGDGR